MCDSLQKALSYTMKSHFQNLNKYLCTSTAIQIIGYKCGSSITSICAFLDTFAKFSCHLSPTIFRRIKYR